MSIDFRLKWVTAKVHRVVEGRKVRATISKSPTNNYFVSIIAELDIESMLEADGKKVKNSKRLIKS